MKILEICCASVPSAVAAQNGGADRIELCENLAQGGVTPGAGKISLAKRLLDIPVCVLIRPRKADFLYNDLEFECMLENIQFAKNLGVDGIVSGALTPKGEIDKEKTARLVEAAGPLPFTFHRAFDMSIDPLASLEQLIELGVNRILTSGAQPTAIEGLSLLKQLAEQAGDRIEIMACGELLPENIDPLLTIPNLNNFHSAVRQQETSKMEYFGATNMGDEAVEEEFKWFEVGEELVRGLREKI